MEDEVGDIPGRVKDSTKDLRSNGLTELLSSVPNVQVGFRIVLYIVSLSVGSMIPIDARSPIVFERGGPSNGRGLPTNVYPSRISVRNDLLAVSDYYII
jgi:hypothetical protein